jgi:tetratricopeptide (TPR) repeat protein
VLAACTPSAHHTLEEEKERHYVAGMTKLHAMDYSGAIESFQKAVEVNPRSAAAHLQLGLLYERTSEECATAIYHFQKYLKLRPNEDYAEVVRQRIVGCKQELAKSVSLGPLSGEMQGQLETLALENQRLKEENRRLGEDNRKWQSYFASLQRPLPQGASSPPDSNLAPAFPAPTAASIPLQSAREESGSSINRTYKVQGGDTLYSIANRQGISVAALERANPGVDSRRLRIGQMLNLPSR